MPRISQLALDALLNQVRDPANHAGTANEVYILDALPADVTNRSNVVANRLNTVAVPHAPGSITGSGGLNSTVLEDRQYQDGGYTTITLDTARMPAIPLYVAVTSDAAGNVVHLIADIAGAGELQSGAVVDLNIWNHIVQTPQ